MKYVYPLVSGLLLLVWIVFGNYPGPGGLPVPALGEFFNPARGFWRVNADADGHRHGDRELTLRHPLAQGSIHFDERGVPHIFAPDLEHAAFLQGYVNAVDRLWQMDLSTRATEGRLSEVLGDRTLARDSLQVRLGYRAAARAATDTMRQHFPDDYTILQAYADGVNARVDEITAADYPLEYKILSHAPLRWSVYRTMLLMKGMSQSLSARHSDAAASQTLADLGPDLFQQLYPARFPRASPIVPNDGQYPRRLTDPLSRLQSPAPPVSPAPASAPLSGYVAPDDGTEPYTLMPRHPANGSNNWAIAPAKSNTGAPLLASDPHLSLTLPSIWYEVQIRYPGVNARGVGLPGAPGIMIGFNDHVAYGETNVGHDVTDWYRIDWTDATRSAYRVDGEVLPTEYRTDTLRVKGAPDRIIRTPVTVFGPVPYADGPYANHAMRYLGHDAPGSDVRPTSSARTFLALMEARNYDDYRTALRGFVDPPQNFVFAARSGDIAIRPNGAFPLRPAGESGRFLTSGSTLANRWRGYVPFGARPEHKNPARRFVSSANQVTTGPAYPYPYVGGFDEYRGRYINRRLTAEKTLNQRKMKELQLDSYSLLAEELTPLLIARINRRALDDNGRALLRLLSEWDYVCSGDSRAATLFEDWRRRVYQLTFDEVPRDSGYLAPEVWRWNDLLREQPRHPIFDVLATDDFRETAATLTQRAFDEIREELAGTMPVEWAERRNSRVRHLGVIPGLGSDLIRSGGSAYSPRALNGQHGASWRMVVELGDTPRAWGALPGGASGNPATPFYDNGLEEWANGRYHELTRWSDADEARASAAASWTFIGNQNTRVPR